MTSIYDQGLDPNSANHVALTTLSFLDRAAQVWPDKVAVIHGPYRTTYGDLGRRCRRLASALRRRGIGAGDTVSVLAPNIPALLEAHYGVPMAGAVLNAINARLDAATVGFINTGVALASQRFYQEAKIPVMNNVATGSIVTQQFKAPEFTDNYIFRADF